MQPDRYKISAHIVGNLSAIAQFHCTCGPARDQGNCGRQRQNSGGGKHKWCMEERVRHVVTCHDVKKAAGSKVRGCYVP